MLNHPVVAAAIEKIQKDAIEKVTSAILKAQQDERAKRSKISHVKSIKDETKDEDTTEELSGEND